MKTVKDLKIGDVVWCLYKTSLNTSKVKSLNGDRPIEFEYSYLNISGNIKYTSIIDNTIIQGNSSDYEVYLNQSEAIIELKKRLCDKMDEQTKVVESEMQKLIIVKNEIAKYL